MDNNSVILQHVPKLSDFYGNLSCVSCKEPVTDNYVLCHQTPDARRNSFEPTYFTDVVHKTCVDRLLNQSGSYDCPSCHKTVTTSLWDRLALRLKIPHHYLMTAAGVAYGMFNTYMAIQPWMMTAPATFSDIAISTLSTVGVGLLTPYAIRSVIETPYLVIGMGVSALWYEASLLVGKRVFLTAASVTFLSVTLGCTQKMLTNVIDIGIKYARGARSELLGQNLKYAVGITAIAGAIFAGAYHFCPLETGAIESISFGKRTVELWAPNVVNFTAKAMTTFFGSIVVKAVFNGGIIGARPLL